MTVTRLTKEIAEQYAPTIYDVKKIIGDEFTYHGKKPVYVLTDTYSDVAILITRSSKLVVGCCATLIAARVARGDHQPDAGSLMTISVFEAPATAQEIFKVVEGRVVVNVVASLADIHVAMDDVDFSKLGSETIDEILANCERSLDEAPILSGVASIGDKEIEKHALSLNENVGLAYMALAQMKVPTAVMDGLVKNYFLNEDTNDRADLSDIADADSLKGNFFTPTDKPFN